jgi:hypothetical protein
MRTINTLQELREERTRLRLQRSVIESEIQQNVRDIKAWIEPLEIVKRKAGKMLVSEHNGMLSDSMGMLANLLGKKVLFRNSGFFVKLLIPFLMKNVTSNIVHENKDKILSWLMDKFVKLTAKHHTNDNGHHYDKGTVHTDYN